MVEVVSKFEMRSILLKRGRLSSRCGLLRLRARRIVADLRQPLAFMFKALSF